MNEELRSRIERCARILKATGNGNIIIDATINPMRYLVDKYGRVRVFYTLEKLEEFSEGILERRRTPSPREKVRRRNYFSHLSMSRAS